MRLGIYYSLRFFSINHMITSSKIIQMIKSNKISNILNESNKILDMDVLSLSLILNELKKQNLQAENCRSILNIIMASLEKNSFDATNSVCSLVRIAKFIKYSDAVTLKIIDFIKSISDDLSPREISDIVSGVYYLNISTKEKIEVLDFMCEKIDKTIDNFASKDKSSIITGLCKIFSPRIKETAHLILEKINTQNIIEMSAACNFLSFCPFDDFMHYFNICENLILENPRELPLIKNQLIHSYSKYKIGSSVLWNFFIDDFIENHNTIDKKSLFLWYKGFHRYGKLSEAKLDKLEIFFESDKKYFSQLQLEHIEFYRVRKIHKIQIPLKENKSDK
ncbi:hypothetical protein SteCoe_11610 [Stentor coeruleus]|uniref:Uncharacterized protein n=1 Tax=Stentor coeruleus TaxID=5963 RepID=A0A1R2CCL7_9CILI|nr:hypothetical protein SteCoe_11610 [Stentor coeruleus]